jgi:hypothetical protein
MILIKDEFKKLIPALTVEEFKQLEQNCLDEGIREKIITWNGFIIDGHNRYEIATRWNLEYETEAKRFKDENEVKLWMIDNQNGRRNLTDGWKYKLQQIKKEILLLKGKEKYEDTVGRPSKKKSLSIVDNDFFRSPRLLNTNDYKKYMDVYKGKTSGCSFAFIDFINTKFYELNVLNKL